MFIKGASVPKIFLLCIDALYRGVEEAFISSLACVEDCTALYSSTTFYLSPLPTFTTFAMVEHDFSIIHNRRNVVHMLVAKRGPPKHTCSDSCRHRGATVVQ